MPIGYNPSPKPTHELEIVQEALADEGMKECRLYKLVTDELYGRSFPYQSSNQKVKNDA